MNALLPGEDADNFGADRRQVCEVARENAVDGLLVHLSCGRKRSNAKMAKWRSSGREKAPSSTKRLLCGGEGKRALGPCEENNLLQSSNTVADKDQRREARMPLLLLHAPDDYAVPPGDDHVIWREWWCLDHSTAPQSTLSMTSLAFF